MLRMVRNTLKENLEGKVDGLSEVSRSWLDTDEERADETEPQEYLQWFSPQGELSARVKKMKQAYLESKKEKVRKRMGRK